jgi:hypothetical protein
MTSSGGWVDAYYFQFATKSRDGDLRMAGGALIFESHASTDMDMRLDALYGEGDARRRIGTSA